MAGGNEGGWRGNDIFVRRLARLMPLRQRLARLCPPLHNWHWCFGGCEGGSRGYCNTKTQRNPQEASHRRKDAKAQRKGRETHLTQRLQGTKTQSDGIIVSESEGEWVTFWSLFRGEVANPNRGAGVLRRLGDGWNRACGASMMKSDFCSSEYCFYCKRRRSTQQKCSERLLGWKS